jgi:hypothetical protein
MTPRERLIRTLKHQPVDRAPRDLWALPGTVMDRQEEMTRLLARYPSDFQGPNARYGAGRRCRGRASEVGVYTDAWGCTWHVAERGVVGEVEPPLADWALAAPASLRAARRGGPGQVEPLCGHRQVRAPAPRPGPFENCSSARLEALFRFGLRHPPVA